MGQIPAAQTPAGVGCQNICRLSIEGHISTLGNAGVVLRTVVVGVDCSNIVEVFDNASTIDRDTVDRGLAISDQKKKKVLVLITRETILC